MGATAKRNASPAALKEIAEVEAEIDRIEPDTLERLAVPRFTAAVPQESAAASG
jgi:hypothetical protein